MDDTWNVTEAEHDARASPTADLGYLALGALVVLEERAMSAAKIGLRAANDLGRPVGSLAARLLPPVVRQPVDDLARRLDARGRELVATASEEAERVGEALVDAVAQHPLMLRAVTQIVDRVIWDVVDEVLPVVLERIATNPEQVREIVQGQSRGMAEELARTARTRAAQGDETVDRWLGRLFRRAPSARDSGAPGAEVPIAATSGVAGTGMNAGPGSYAGVVSRGIAFAIDAAAALTICTVGLFATRAVLAALGLISLDEDAGALAYVFAVPVVFAAYSAVFWMLVGRTPGMMLLGLRVVTAGGDHPGARRSIIRALGYWVSAIALVGFAWIAIDARKQGFHDKLAGTFVVYAWGTSTAPSARDGVKRSSAPRPPADDAGRRPLRAPAAGRARAVAAPGTPRRP